MEAPEAVKPPGPVQVKVAPAAALLPVKVAVAPWQILCVAGAIVQVAFGLTTRVAVQVPTQPFASVTVAVYVPAVPTVMDGPEAVNPPGPVQVNVAPAAALLAVNVAVAPWQTLCVAGAIV